jgi:hypothetical protein
MWVRAWAWAIWWMKCAPMVGVCGHVVILCRNKMVIRKTWSFHGGWLWRMAFPGLWRRVVLVWADVSEERIASIFRVENSASEEPAWAGGCSVGQLRAPRVLPGTWCALLTLLWRHRLVTLNMLRVCPDLNPCRCVCWTQTLYIHTHSVYSLIPWRWGQHIPLTP